MPADILATDTLFPELNGKESTDQKFEMVTDYLWLLREQLTFALTNLGIANFNAAQLGKLSNVLSEPFAVQLAEQDKKFAEFAVTIDAISGTVSEFDSTYMKQTAFSVSTEGIKVTVGSTTKNLVSTTKLTSTANSLTSTISSVRDTANSAKTAADNAVSKSSATQTSTGFELSVMGTSSSGSPQTRMKLTKDGLKIYNKAGTAVFAFDTTSGNLKICGTITGSTIYGSTFTTLQSADSSGDYLVLDSEGLIFFDSNGRKHGVHIAPEAGSNESFMTFYKHGTYSGAIGFAFDMDIMSLYSDYPIFITANSGRSYLRFLSTGRVEIYAPDGLWVNGNYVA